MKTLEAKLVRLKDEVLQELKSIDIHINDGVVYRINNRLRGVFGRCIKRGNKYTIEIAEYLLLGADEHIKEVLVHETLHTLPGCLNHGSKWKMWGEKVSRELGYNVCRLIDAEEVIAAIGIKEYAKRFKYMAECQGCGAQIFRSKKSDLIKAPERFRCSGCGGRYTITEL